MSKEQESIQVLIEKYQVELDKNVNVLFTGNIDLERKNRLLVLNATIEQFINELETILR